MIGSISSDPAGAFYSYRRQGNDWGQEVKVTGPPNGSIFGRPLDLDQGVLVVGDTDNNNSNGQSAGAAYVYEQSGPNWTFVQKLLAPNGTPFDKFSTSLAIAGDTIAIGASAANPGGAAYVFEFDGTAWSATQTLFPGNPTLGFGVSIAIDDDGDRIVVGAPNEDTPTWTNVGAAYVFRRVPDGWVQEARLADDTAPAFEFFGASVSIDGPRILVGATANDDMASNAGAAWIYELQDGTWNPVQKFYPSDIFDDQRFGHRVRLKGDTAIVSGHLSLPAVYKIYQFQRIGTVWTEVAQFINSDNTTFDGFGENFDFEGGNVLSSGANGAYTGSIRSGAAYVHVLDVPTEPYCTGKTNSSGCVPVIADSGTPTFTGPDDYVVAATNALPTKPGLFFFGLQGPFAVPFFGGTLCVSPPLARTAVQLSTSGAGCSGTYAHALSQAQMASYGLFPGQTVHGQYWMRDPAHPDGTGVGLSNALELSIQP